MNSTLVPIAASILSSGVDWLTVTCSDKSRRQDLLSLGHALVRDAQTFGEKTSLLRAHGYVGVASAHCAVGERRDDAYLRLSGSAANYHWLAAAASATNVSRLDIQTTVEMSAQWLNWSEQIYGDLSLWAELHSKRTAVARLYDREGGATVYCGKRTSNRFGRIYDKGVEASSAVEGTQIRYEWEYKAALANKIVTRLNANDDCASNCRALIASELARRNVTPPGLCAADGHLPVVGRPLPDADRTRAYWLRIARAGIVRELQRSSRAEVTALLGLS